MIPFLFTPLGRYVAIGSLILLVGGGLYMKIRADAVAEMQAAAQADALRSTDNAVRAGAAVDLSPDGLLKSDGHKRD